MGPVIDVRFEHNEVPKINNALVIDVPKEEGTIQLTLEVALTIRRRRCSYNCDGFN